MIDFQLKYFTRIVKNIVDGPLTWMNKIYCDEEIILFKYGHTN